MLLRPEVGRLTTNIETCPAVPFFAGAAFPSEISQIVKGGLGSAIANPGTLVAPAAKRKKPNKLFRFLIPAVVSGANDFAIVAPGLGKWILASGVIPVETEPGCFPYEVTADVTR